MLRHCDDWIAFLNTWWIIRFENINYFNDNISIPIVQIVDSEDKKVKSSISMINIIIEWGYMEWIYRVSP